MSTQPSPPLRIESCPIGNILKIVGGGRVRAGDGGTAAYPGRREAKRHRPACRGAPCGRPNARTGGEQGWATTRRATTRVAPTDCWGAVGFVLATAGRRRIRAAARPSGTGPPVGAPLVGARTPEQAGNKGGRPQGGRPQGLPLRIVGVRSGSWRRWLVTPFLPPDVHQRRAARRKTPCSGAPEACSQRLLSRLSDARPRLNRPPRR